MVRFVSLTWTLFKLAEHCHRTNINSKNFTIIIIIIMVCWGGGDFLLWLQFGVQLGEGHKLEL